MRNLQNIGNQIAQSKYANVEIGSSEGLEAIVADVAVEAVNLEADSAMHADLGNVIASLESIADQAGASIADGGLDRQSAGILEVAVESHLGRVGLSANDAMVSIESFGGTTTQLEATQVSVEAIKEKAKQLWDFLVKKFKEAREKIYQWFKKVFSGAAKLKSRAEAIAKKAVDKKGEKNEGAEDIKLGGSAKNLVDENGKFDISKLAEGVKTYVAGAKEIYGKHAKGVANMAGGAAEMMDAVASAPKEDLEGSDSSKFFSGGKFLGKDVAETPQPGGGAVFLGGRKFKIEGAGEKPTNMVELKSAFDKLNIVFDFEEKAPKVADDIEFTAIEPGKVKDIAEDVVSLAEEIISFEADFFKHAKATEKADVAAGKLGKALDKLSLGSAGKEANKVCSAMYSALNRTTSQPTNGFTSAAISSGRSALEVCEKSLAQYS